MITQERMDRVRELLKLSKAELVAMVRRHWAGGSQPPEKWRKEELAGDIADFEEGREIYSAYGEVPLINGRPAAGTRPRCGGIDCSGHAQPTLPWLEVRDRFRQKGLCIGALPEPAGPAEAQVRFLQDTPSPNFEYPNTIMNFRAGDARKAYRWRAEDGTVDETTWWTSRQEEARFAHRIAGDAVEVI